MVLACLGVSAGDSGLAVVNTNAEHLVRWWRCTAMYYSRKAVTVILLADRLLIQSHSPVEPDARLTTLLHAGQPPLRLRAQG